MAEHSQDVIGLYAGEAVTALEALGNRVLIVSTASKEHPIEQLRVIRQKHIGQDLTELVLSVDTITGKGGGNGGIQNY